MGDMQQNFELTLPRNVVEKCYLLKPGDGAKFLSTNFAKKIISQLKLYKQADESVRIAIEVNELKSINKHQPQFVCIEGATKDFQGSYSAPEEFVENNKQQLEEDTQERGQQELMLALNKSLKTLDKLEEDGGEDQEEDLPETIMAGEKDAQGQTDTGCDVMEQEVEGDKLPTGVAVGKLALEESDACALEPLETDITCQITLPKVDLKPTLRDSLLSASRPAIKPEPEVTRKRKQESSCAEEPSKKIQYKRERNVPCPSCDVLLKDYDSVHDHLRSMHRTEDTYEDHITQVRARMRVRCTVCDNELCSKDQLAVHMRQVHNKGPDVKCPHCDSSFRSLDYLKSHIKRVHLDKGKDKKFLCHLCPASFRYKSYLTSHVRLVHSDNAKDSYRCDICGHTCSHEKYLKNHHARVHGDRKYTCSYCARAFTTSANMQRHVKLVHEKSDNPKPFQCEECGKRFSLKANMTEHVKATHYVEYKFQCGVCKAGFRRRKQLDNHKCIARILHPADVGGATSIIMLPYGADLSGGGENSIVITEQGQGESVEGGKDEGVEYQYIISSLPT